jgi:hypothetical protein
MEQRERASTSEEKEIQARGMGGARPGQWANCPDDRQGRLGVETVWRSGRGTPVWSTFVRTTAEDWIRMQ